MFLTLMWIAVAAGMVTVVTAAMKVQKNIVCSGYDVQIIGAEQDKLFTSKEQIVSLLKAATKGEIQGQRLNEFNLPQIEDLLEQSAWVYNAELFFDNMDRLRVNVIERKPLARVFTNLGTSFYIDEAGKQIPLSEKISLDVPVFTGYPNKRILDASDSALLRNVIATASFINADAFWSSQVSQIDINNCGPDCWEMEMVPVLGNHRVQLGDGSDVASKFHRLYLFYDQVLKRKGFDKYEKIDVQYEGQVLGIRDAHTRVDSLQLRKNIETLLHQSRQANELIEGTPNIGLSFYVPDTTAAQNDLYENAVPPVEESIAMADVPQQEQKAADVSVNKKQDNVTAAKPAFKKEEKKAASKKDVKSTASKNKDAGKEIKKPNAKEEVKSVTKKAETKKETKPAAKSSATKKTETKKVVKKPDSKKAVEKTDNKKPVATSAKKPAASAKKPASTAKAAEKPKAATSSKASNKKKSN